MMFMSSSRRNAVTMNFSGKNMARVSCPGPRIGTFGIHWLTIWIVSAFAMNAENLWFKVFFLKQANTTARKNVCSNIPLGNTIWNYMPTAMETLSGQHGTKTLRHSLDG